MKSADESGKPITTLSFSRMKVRVSISTHPKPGMVVLGCIKEVMKHQLLIGLPFNLSGYGVEDGNNC